MIETTYGELEGWVVRLESLGQLARAYDSVEVAMTFSSPYISELPGIGYVRGMVQNDARAAWSRVRNAQARLQVAHAWLAQSRESVGALDQGGESWRKARELSGDTLNDMIGIEKNDGAWDGAGAAGQRSVAKAQVEAQKSLLEATVALELGCAAAQTVMRCVFSDVSMVLAGGFMQAAGVCLRAPSVNYNLFALNSRMKTLAGVLEVTASRYEAIRYGDGWMSHSFALRDLFAKHGHILQLAGEQSRRAMPV